MPKPRFDQSKILTKDEWKKVLTDAMEDFEEELQELDEMLDCEQVDVEKEWTKWKEVAQGVDQTTVRDVMQRQLSTEEDIEAMRKQLKIKTKKGEEAQYRRRTGNADTKEENKSSKA